jgi:hypothetical protein
VARLLDANDAHNITIPHIILASKDESQEKIADYKVNLEAKPSLGSEVETYDTMAHGWMGARADLDNEEANREFERG